MIRKLEKVIRGFTNLLCAIGMIMLAALMLLGSVDVVGRYFFNVPVKGTFEISEILLAGIVFFGWAYAMSTGGHVTVDTFFYHFPPRVRAVVGAATSFVSMVIFVLIGWQGALKVVASWKAERYIDVVGWPIAPFESFVCIGSLALFLELLLNMLHHLQDLGGEG